MEEKQNYIIGLSFLALFNLGIDLAENFAACEDFDLCNSREFWP